MRSPSKVYTPEAIPPPPVKLAVVRLYFLRHGIAEDRLPGRADGDRRLTPRGSEEMARVARGMAVLGLRFDVVRTSPLLRARETAAIVAETLNLEDCLEEDDRLACGAGLGELRDVLDDAGEPEEVLLVGHEPDCSDLIATLIGGGYVRMKKASLACVSVEEPAPGHGVLRWLLEAEQLGAIAG